MKYKVEVVKHEDLEEEEWKNGDDCIYKGVQCFFVGNLKVVGVPIRGDCMIQHKGGAPLVVLLSEVYKPETETQKLEREREEAIYDMCSSVDNHTEAARFWAGRFYDAKCREGEINERTF